MKPLWSDAPEWAGYLAQDSDGYWWWYQKHPERDDQAWYTPGRAESAMLPTDGAWYETLEERPK